jgi:hypothetical protein
MHQPRERAKQMCQQECSASWICGSRAGSSPANPGSDQDQSNSRAGCLQAAIYVQQQNDRKMEKPQASNETKCNQSVE